MKISDLTDKSCHSHNHSDCNYTGIELHRHEDALVCSGERDIIGDLEAVKEKMILELRSLAQWIDEQGGITGHIKSIVHLQSEGYMLSTTDGEVNTKEISQNRVHISIVAIVFKVDEKQLKCRIASLINGL